MSMVSSRPMSLHSIEFQELYARHLCRHSQFGINVAHLLALFGTWFGVYGFVHWLLRSEWAPVGLATWVPIGMAAAYLAAVAINVPVRVTVATALFLAVFLAAVFWLPELPLWAYLLMIPVFYKLQAWSHKWFNVEQDMTEFNKKYEKGLVLFIVLLFYEVPLVLNYLIFDRKS
jgi:hypothetical protein